MKGGPQPKNIKIKYQALESELLISRYMNYYANSFMITGLKFLFKTIRKSKV